MAKIIQYNEGVKKAKRQERTDYSSHEIKQYNDIVKQLRLKRNENKYDYSIEEIKNIVDDILKLDKYYNRNCATPIVKIVNKFGIGAYKVDLNKEISGKLFVNGTTKELYNTDSVILVNNKDKIYYQRFIVAYQLACFLFEYIGSNSDKDNRILFSDEYILNRPSLRNEGIKYRFATEILMPERMFCKQYIIANQECYYTNRETRNMFIIKYLSQFFEVETKLVIKRINEIIAKG